MPLCQNNKTMADKKGWSIKIGNKKLMIMHRSLLMDIPVIVLLGIKPHIKVFGYYIYFKKQNNG